MGKLENIIALFTCGYGLVTGITYLVCMICVNQWMHESLQYTDYSIAIAQQVSRDWLVKPFTDIIVTTDTQCPSSHPDLVFTRTFLGSNIACDCFGIIDEWYGGNTFTNGRPCGHNETS